MEELFSLDSDGNILYNGEVSEDGFSDNLYGDVETGISLSDEEILPEDNEVSSSDSVLDGDISNYDNLVSFLASDAVAGTMSSATLEFFDRVVDGLPSNCGYIAYKTSSDDAYAGSLIYGLDYDVNGSSIVFGDDAIELKLSRYYDSNRNYYMSYSEDNASGTAINLPSGGTLLYYTNLVAGRPTLGNGSRPFDIGSYIVVALLAVMASLVMSRIVRGR